MAVIQIAAINIPAGADTTDTLAALTAYYANNSTPNPTNAQMLEFMRQDVISKIKSITRAYRQAQVVIADPAAT